MDFEKILDELSVDELVGQTLCPIIDGDIEDEELEKLVVALKPGSFFATGVTKEQIKRITDVINKHTKVPAIMTSDIENGPGTPLKDEYHTPFQMALGACDDPDLVERLGRTVGQICRSNGVHWGFNPVVDVNSNFRCPESNIRSISDDPDHVIKIASAFLKGFREDGMMACSIKHFPGQGTDERNSHLSCIENNLPKDEWMNTVGRIYKTLFKQGVDSVMIGHCALPAFETEKDDFGYIPATFSKTIITDLLKGELGFDGVVMSDAMCMVGVASRCPVEELPVKYIQAGGDVFLFPKISDRERIVRAVESGEIPMDRLKDAVRRILKVKHTLHAFEPGYFDNLTVTDDLTAISREIAEKSITVIRDFDNIIPTKLQKGDKVLMLNIVDTIHNKPLAGNEFYPLKEELERNGLVVDYFDNHLYSEINKIKDNYDVILINSHLCCENYHGGTMRLGWVTAFMFWDGYVLNHPRVIFTSFGDPYKLFDCPFVRTYINTYSPCKDSQEALARVVLGQVKPQGKSPVALKGYFERQI